jgi:hypothetical protein
MANVLNEEKKQQVLALGRLGWSLRHIQQATRIRRETASAYLKAAGIAVRPPGGWGRHAPKPANEVITDSTVVTGPSACELYREAIDLGLSRGRNARAIWQDLVSEYGFASSYQSVQRFVRKRRGTQTQEARVVIVTAPGQEAQVDYGTGPMVRDPLTGKYRRTRLFVMTGFVRRYLERCPQAPLSLQQVDPLIRELVQYCDLINYRTKEVEE